MLTETRFYVGLHAGSTLVGFGRLQADVFAAQILDVITHPQHRRRGLALRSVGDTAASALVQPADDHLRVARPGPCSAQQQLECVRVAALPKELPAALADLLQRNGVIAPHRHSTVTLLARFRG
jgi:hypothetical protein